MSPSRRKPVLSSFHPIAPSRDESQDAPMPESVLGKEITVSVVEDDPALRETLARYLQTKGFRCVSTHGAAEEAIKDLPSVQPEVVLMDIHLPGKTGIECLNELRGRIPRTK